MVKTRGVASIQARRKHLSDDFVYHGHNIDCFEGEDNISEINDETSSANSAAAVPGTRKSPRALHSASASTTRIISTSITTTENKTNYGPWTPEEHGLFTLGYKKYKDCKNRWKLISQEFVATRTPKQIGIHAYYLPGGLLDDDEGDNKEDDDEEGGKRLDNIHRDERGANHPARVVIKQVAEKDTDTSSRNSGSNSSDMDGSKGQSRGIVEKENKSTRRTSRKSAGDAKSDNDTIVPTLKTGMWTSEEHTAFLAGYEKYKNRWSLIAENYVPTRSAKQIGSHALQYFTTLGEWVGRDGQQKGGEEGVEGQQINVGDKRERRRRKCSSKGQSSNIDEKDANKSNADDNTNTAVTSVDDDGNFNQCIVCDNEGILVCCHKCPRAYHTKCLAQDGCSMDIKSLPPDWICQRCDEWDDFILPEESEEISPCSMNRAIKASYSKFKDCPNYIYYVVLLGLIIDILNKLKIYDYGYIFSDPVDGESAPGYYDVIETPMDYGTIISRLETGDYADCVSTFIDKNKSPSSSVNEKYKTTSPMEQIICRVIHDVDQVFENCRIFNPNGNSFFRAGEIHVRKWKAYFNRFVLGRLSEKVKFDLETIASCSNAPCSSLEQKELHKYSNTSETAEKANAHDVLSSTSDCDQGDCNHPEQPKDKTKRRRCRSKSSCENSLSTSILKSGAWTPEEHTKFLEGYDKHRNRWSKISEEYVPTRSAKQIGSHALYHLTELGEWGVEKKEDEVTNVSRTDAKNNVHNKEDANHMMTPVTARDAVSDEIKPESIISPPAKKKLRRTPNSEVPTSNPEADTAINDETPNSQHYMEEMLAEDSESQQGETLKQNQEKSKKNSPVLLLTKNQILALGHVFFTPVDLLRNEVVHEEFDDYLKVNVGHKNFSEKKEDKHLANQSKQVIPSTPNLATCASSTSASEICPDFASPSLDTRNQTSSDTMTHYPTIQETESKNKRKDMFLKHWYDRLCDLRSHKLTQGTAVTSATHHVKIYHWANRQRKRYHLTLHRMPHLRSICGNERQNKTKSEAQSADEAWLLTMPIMKGDFALDSTLSFPSTNVEREGSSFRQTNRRHRSSNSMPNKKVTSNRAVKIAAIILQKKDRQFWHDCLEELRFFHGDNQHTLVPHNFPHNKLLCVWVEINRAKLLLQILGVWSGLTFGQIFVLDELKVGELDDLSFRELRTLLPSTTLSSNQSFNKAHASIHGHGERTDRCESNAITSLPHLASAQDEENGWSDYFNKFKEWLHQARVDEERRSIASLARTNWSLYTWCWKQCHASSAVLRGTPCVKGTEMSARKLKLLASSTFFHIFPYDDKTLVCENSYFGSEEWDAAFRHLEVFSIKHGTTIIPPYYSCDPSFNLWLNAMQENIFNLSKGELCELSTEQIEKLILVGFCSDREKNLSRSDVIWLKYFFELRRYQDLFGDCQVTCDFPRLHQWVHEQKYLFKLKRMGKQELMKNVRLSMLMDAGIDFFTGECCPYPVTQDVLNEFESLVALPTESHFQVGSINGGRDDLNRHEKSYKAMFKDMKLQLGHCLILASDNEDLYWWFMENRTQLAKCHATQKGHINHLHSFLSCITGDGSKNELEDFRTNQPLFQWLIYCERLLMFKARTGHSEIPPDYPDKALVQWLLQQQDRIYLYSSNEPTKSLPLQLKLLVSLGLQGRELKKQPPTLSSRVIRKVLLSNM